MHELGIGLLSKQPTETSPEFSLVYSIYNSMLAAIGTAAAEKEVHFSDQLKNSRRTGTRLPISWEPSSKEIITGGVEVTL